MIIHHLTACRRVIVRKIFLIFYVPILIETLDQRATEVEVRCRSQCPPLHLRATSRKIHPINHDHDQGKEGRKKRRKKKNDQTRQSGVIVVRESRLQ
jgi:hypothetical protein